VATFISIRGSGQDVIMPKRQETDETLKGWNAIAKYLGQPVSTTQRWAQEGMPVTRIGRYVGASLAELERWLMREVGAKKPVHIAKAQEDLVADLRRGLLEARQAKQKRA